MTSDIRDDCQKHEPGYLKSKSIVFFDGSCVLCNRAVLFMCANDRVEALLFSSLQGETVEPLKRRNPAVEAADSTVILVENFETENEIVYLRSTAILRMLREIGGLWRAVAWLRFIPSAVRDAVYDWVANNRFGWFGKYDDCPVPPLKWRRRFLP